MVLRYLEEGIVTHALVTYEGANSFSSGCINVVIKGNEKLLD